MKKTELKKMLKPLIKECIKEVIFEDGTLSSIISEVMKGVGQPIVEQKQPFPTKQKPQYETEDQARARLNEQRKKMMEAIGGDAYNGVNLFEGTTPTKAAPSETSGRGPLEGVDPNDPGVDISSVMNKSSAIWSKMKRKK
tara:strand:+ start:13937 stop:14356 length:420 start_codon:yes stop_codon:yes gene_type:complete